MFAVMQGLNLDVETKIWPGCWINTSERAQWSRLERLWGEFLLSALPHTKLVLCI